MLTLLNLYGSGSAAVDLTAEGGDAGDSPAEDECVDVVGPLVRVHCLQVHYVPDNVIFIGYSVSSKHIPALSSNIQSLSTIVSLQQRNHFWNHFPSSFSLPSCRQEWRPSVISVVASASFFCIS